MLRFVVLSDIHFRAGIVGEVWDRDNDVRARLLDDLRTVSADLGSATGILVNGDIAFAGAKTEYEFAQEWLAKVCDAAGCPRDRVWTVPGNHDVERAAVRDDPAIRVLHQQLRDVPTESIDDVLEDWLRSGRSDLLFAHIEQYNDFAAAYGCAISPQRPVWQHSIELNEGWTLRLLGLNSTFCSDADDTSLADQGKLVLGSLQATAAQTEPGVVYLALCHHPLRWLRDEMQVERVLCSRHAVNIFGHEHRQDPHIRRGSLWLHCGAVHPVRAEPGWVPTYNVLELGVEAGSDRPELVVRLYTRVWHDDHRFRPEWTDRGEVANMERLRLKPWAPIPVDASADVMVPNASSEVQTVLLPPSPRAAFMESERRLAYHFLTLPHHERVEIVVRLGLVRDEDEGVRDRELFGRVFQRALDERRLADLWLEVERRHPNGQPDPNPFHR